MSHVTQVDRKGLFLLAPEEAYFTHDNLQIKRVQFPVTDASVRIVYSAQGDEYDACVVDLAKPHQMSDEVFFLASYVMISRAKSLDGLLITRLCERAALERGAPQYLLDEVDRLLGLERQSNSALKAYLQKVLTTLPLDILALFSGSDTVPHALDHTSSSVEPAGAQCQGSLESTSIRTRASLSSQDAASTSSASMRPASTQQGSDVGVVRKRLFSKSSPSKQWVAHVSDAGCVPEQLQRSKAMGSSSSDLNTSCPEAHVAESPQKQGTAAVQSMDVAGQLGYISSMDIIEDNLIEALHNSGNTCYLNAMLHVFARVPALCQWSRQHAARWGELHRGLACPLCLLAKDVTRLRVDVAPAPFEAEVVQHRALWSQGVFEDSRQHDVTEAIGSLLDSMNSVDERAMTAVDPRFSARPVDDASRFTTPMWKSLQIQSTSRMHCYACNHVSDRPERLNTLALELPEQTQRLEVLLEAHFGDQPLRQGEDPYRCPNTPPCGPEALVTRAVTPRQWPEVLVLSFKRWKTYFQDGLPMMRKISTMVDFSTPLLVPNGDAPYHLRGVIEHHGAQAGGGHYTSYVRACNNSWYHCDDEQSPQQVSIDRVLHAQAYVLVYET